MQRSPTRRFYEMTTRTVSRVSGFELAAIAAYGEAIRIGRRDIFYPQYLQSRAAAYLALKDIDRAIADYDEAIKVNPLNGGPRRLTEHKRAMRLSWLAEAYWLRGKALLERGDDAHAEQDFENASKLGKIGFEHGGIT